MSPLVSVIVPVHDVKDYLGPCVASIAGQTYADLDIILVDDGSTDGSADLCDQWARRDSRITAVHTRARGTSSARNTGLDIARGELVTFVDSDDVAAPELVSLMVTMLTTAEADIATVGSVSITGALPEMDDADAPMLVESADVALRRIVCDRPRWEVWGRLYRRHLWDGVRFPVGLVHQDLHVTPRVFSRAHTVVSSPARLYGYRTRPGSIMDDTRQRALSLDLLTVLADNIELARGQSKSPQEFGVYAGAYLLHASKQLERLQHRDAWQRNAAFRAAYVRFARAHRRDMLLSSEVSAPFKAAWLLSSVSPRAFRDGFRVASWGKRLGVSGLRRGRRSDGRRRDG